MKPIPVLLLLVLLCGAVHAVSAEGPAIEWQKLLGGSGSETAHSVQQTADGGYILLGGSSSSASGDVTGTRHGSFTDFWVVKLDQTGTIQWQKLLGGTGDDEGYSVQQTADGGYILLGTSGSSQSGDVTGTNHGGSSDLWVVKLNGAGTIQWQKLLGGSGWDAGHSVQQTADGGYILFGTSSSSKSGDVTGTTQGLRDYWVVKLNGTGTILWQKVLGGGGNDEGHSIRQTADGGYILLGESDSNVGGMISHGGLDSLVMKLDSTGTIQWQRLLGGIAGETGYSVQQTADGGYVLLGLSWSSQSGDIPGTNHGNCDYWVVKLDDTGAIEWQRLLGGSMYDEGDSVQQTADGGYILLGSSYWHADGDITGTNHGDDDYWVVKLDDTGSIEWQKLLGGSGADRGYSVRQTADGGYVLLGHSQSSASGDVTGINHGSYGDFWVVKLKGGSRVAAVPGGAGIPQDLDSNGKYEDVNGNGRMDFADVVLYFNQMSWIAANEPVALFDYNGNGRIDFADVTRIFTLLGGPIGTPAQTTAATFTPGPGNWIPGRIEAEDYNPGGEGVAYYDTTSTNDGGAYRPSEGVDIEMATALGSYVVCWIRPGEWLKYTTNVRTTSDYDVVFRVSSPYADTQIRLQVDGVTATTFTVPNTGSYDTYTSVTQRIPLTYGAHVLRLYFGGYQNIDSMTFGAAGSSASAHAIVPLTDATTATVIVATNVTTT